VKPIAEVSAETAPADGIADAVAKHATVVPQVESAAPTAPAADPGVRAEPEVAVEPVPEPAPNPRPRRGRAAKATGRRAAKAARSAPAATPAEGTQARQSDRPSGEQFLADLADAGSFKALAEKYSKSIGTIGNWANQLREQGFDIPGGRQKKA
jgi:hypothetical protein